MARLGPLPKFRWTKSDGTPLASGKVNTYVTSTSTPKATYTDRGALSQNANPVILDSNGEADIWLDTDARYRFVIQDADSVTLATIDDITSIAETTDFSGLSNVVEDTTPQLGGSLDINGKNIVSTSNADINILPNGTGTVVIGTDLDVDNLNLDGNTLTTLAGDLTLAAFAGSNIASSTNVNLTSTLTVTGNIAVDNIDINGNTIKSTDTAGAINLTPDTTGDLVLDGLKWPQADGTANQIIKTDGAGQLSFTNTTPQAAAAWTEVTSTTASADAEIKFTALTTYEEYMFQFEALRPATDGTLLRISFSVDNGSTDLSSTIDYIRLASETSIIIFVTDSGTIALGPGGADDQGNLAGETLDGQLRLKRNTEGSDWAYVDWTTAYKNASAADEAVSGNGIIRQTTSDIDSVRFHYDAGNITSGTIRVFGR